MIRLLPAAALFLGACASTSTTPELLVEEVQALTRDGDYEGAVRVAAAAREQVPEDSPLGAQLQRATVEISIASGLSKARDLSLADRDDEALAVLVDLEEHFPREPIVDAWRRRTQRKLSDHWYEIARAALATGNFEGARVAYEKALTYEPDHDLAPAGLARVELLREYRAEMAEDYYYNGVRDLTEQRLSESENSFEKSKRYDAEADRTRRRIAEVRREKAVGRKAYAEQLVADRRYAAARAEYAEAERLDPESQEIAEAHALMQVESEVAALLSEAESFVLRGDFDGAALLLDDAASKTQLQVDLVEATRARISSTQVELQYQRALDLEHDFLFEEAIEGYRAVLEGRDFYEDARARLDTLESYVVEAARLYAEAEEAEGDEAKLERLRQIEVFWPEYRDILEQISAIEGE